MKHSDNFVSCISTVIQDEVFCVIVLVQSYKMNCSNIDIRPKIYIITLGFNLSTGFLTYPHPVDNVDKMHDFHRYTGFVQKTRFYTRSQLYQGFEGSTKGILSTGWTNEIFTRNPVIPRV